MTTLTPAQARALEWLPSSGEWRGEATKDIIAALRSFALYYREFAESRGGPYGKRGGWQWQYRLTPAGIDFKVEWEKRT